MDIVDQLRIVPLETDDGSLCHEAAQEIERLRERLEEVYAKAVFARMHVSTRHCLCEYWFEEIAKLCQDNGQEAGEECDGTA